MQTLCLHEWMQIRSYGEQRDRGMRSISRCLFAHENHIPAEREVYMLQIKNLTIIHKKDLRTMIEDFSFVLNPGDKAVLIGEEGNGKSTLMKWIYAPESIEDYVEAEGERICSGEKLGFLPQELPAEDKLRTVYDFFCQEEMFWEQEPKELAELARNLHMPTDFYYSDQLMGTLSGGEKVKAQMARLLMGKPTILLLDEPSNDIDIETLEWLEELIIKAEQPVLFISHDETLIERTANVVIHLEQIRRKTQSRYTVARVSYQEYLNQRNALMANQERNARNEKRQEEIRQEKLNRIMQKVEHAQENVSRQEPSVGRLLKKKMKAVKSMEKRFERQAEDMTQMPESEEAIFFKVGDKEAKIPAGKVVLDFSLDKLVKPVSECSGENGENKMGVCEGVVEAGKNTVGAEEILACNVNLFIKGSEKVCIIGRNGAGKTTLLRKLAEELLAREDIRAAYMPQNYEELLDLNQTPVEYLCRVGDKEETTRIRTWLGSLKYTADEMSHSIGELSGGQKAKVLLLKMSISGANVLILDEPTRNFSPLSNPVIREVLRNYEGAILSVSHDRKYISEVCDKVYELTESGLKTME